MITLNTIETLIAQKRAIIEQCEKDLLLLEDLMKGAERDAENLRRLRRIAGEVEPVLATGARETVLIRYAAKEPKPVLTWKTFAEALAGGPKKRMDLRRALAAFPKHNVVMMLERRVRAGQVLVDKTTTPHTYSLAPGAKVA